MNPARLPRKLSCGVLVTDGARLLLGHATRSPRWDIPKGLAEPGESALDAALRELREETGLVADPAGLRPLGTHAYLRDKDLALFVWHPDPMPDPATLSCTALVTLADGTSFPELDRFALLAWPEVYVRAGKNMSRVLKTLKPHDLELVV